MTTGRAIDYLVDRVRELRTEPREAGSMASNRTPFSHKELSSLNPFDDCLMVV